MIIVIVVREVIGPKHFSFVELVSTAYAGGRRWREREHSEKSVARRWPPLTVAGRFHCWFWYQRVFSQRERERERFRERLCFCVWERNWCGGESRIWELKKKSFRCGTHGSLSLLTWPMLWVLVFPLMGPILQIKERMVIIIGKC